MSSSIQAIHMGMVFKRLFAKHDQGQVSAVNDGSIEILFPSGEMLAIHDTAKGVAPYAVVANTFGKTFTEWDICPNQSYIRLSQDELRIDDVLTVRGISQCLLWQSGPGIRCTPPSVLGLNGIEEQLSQLLRPEWPERLHKMLILLDPKQSLEVIRENAASEDIKLLADMLVAIRDAQYEQFIRSCRAYADCQVVNDVLLSAMLSTLAWCSHYYKHPFDAQQIAHEVLPVLSQYVNIARFNQLKYEVVGQTNQLRQDLFECVFSDRGSMAYTNVKWMLYLKTRETMDFLAGVIVTLRYMVERLVIEMEEQQQNK